MAARRACDIPWSASHHRVMPLFVPLGKNKLAERRATHREDDRAQKGECHGPARLNFSFHALQRKDGSLPLMIGHRIEHRPLHLNAWCRRSFRSHGLSSCPAGPRARNDVSSTITTAPSTTIPKSSVPRDRRFAELPFQVQTRRGAQAARKRRSAHPSRQYFREIDTE